MLKDGIIIGERYEIVSRVGSGGMADVYKAMDHKLNRMVAVKILKPEFRQDTSFIAKFRKEAQAAAGLAHPNIVNVYDVGEDRGLYYIVMELVEGITLKNYIMKKGKLSVKEATSIAIQVSLGLEAAHNQGIIHRDVKPQNIIISTDGKVKLSDFGIAKATNSNTITANVMGSVHYSSPEQVRGGFSDAKSDIYSLGITMYEMVTGRVPFDGDTTVSIAIKHLQEEIIPPSRYTSDLPYAFEQIILKCTQKDPNRRYADMGELIEDLKKSLIDPQGNFVVIPSAAGAAAAAAGSVPEQAPERARRTDASDRAAKASAREAASRRYDDDDDEDDIEDDFHHDREETRRKYKKKYRSDDEDDASGNRLEKAITIGGFCIGAVIVVILIVLIGNMAGLFTGSGSSSSSASTSASSSAEVTVIPTESDSEDMVAVPNFMGMTLDEAMTLANQYGLVVRQSGTQNSDNYAEGQIVYQETLSNTMVKSGSTINVVISAGSTNVTIPTGIVGAQQSDAENTLGSLGLNVIAQLQASDVAVGCVISISPQEGSQVSPGSDVYIYISRGADTTGTTGTTDAGQTSSATTTDTTQDTTASQTAVAASGTNDANAGSGLVTTVDIVEPYEYEGGDVTLQLVQGGTATIVYQGAGPWPDDNTAVTFTVYGASGYTSGTLQLLGWDGSVIGTYEVAFG